MAATFLQLLRSLHDGLVVCEPRHATWFCASASSLLGEYRISRVAADPSPLPTPAVPGGWPGVAYFRLHGSPRTYWSRYDDDAIATLAQTVRHTPSAHVWCVFDNTASGAALQNACELHALLLRSSEPHKSASSDEGELMPFKSQAQRRKFAQLLVEGKISKETFEEWNRETGGKKLPERARKKAKGRGKAAAPQAGGEETLTSFIEWRGEGQASAAGDVNEQRWRRERESLPVTTRL